ncbi:MAG: ribbon-helix-helix domain-containing protein [Acidimicrobiales bacterium]
MATITVRLDNDDEKLLDEITAIYGSRSTAIREAIRALSGQVERDRAIDEALAAWEAEAGPVDENEVAAMIERYDL